MSQDAQLYTLAWSTVNYFHMLKKNMMPLVKGQSVHRCTFNKSLNCVELYGYLKKIYNVTSPNYVLFPFVIKYFRFIFSSKYKQKLLTYQQRESKILVALEIVITSSTDELILNLLNLVFTQ